MDLNFRDDPILIGAIGGAGTRVVAKIVRHGEIFMGKQLNSQEDSAPFIDFYNAWIPLYLNKQGNLPHEIQKFLEADFAAYLNRHLQDIPATDCRWGIKNPKSIHMLPFWNQMFPKLKFIHVVRNGLDVVYSKNQGQFECYKELLFDRQEQKEQKIFGRQGKIAFWYRVNQLAADYGKSEMQGRYLMIRFEDLCNNPERIVGQIFDFLEVHEPDKLTNAIAEVSSKGTTGRWSKGLIREIYNVMQVGKPGLEYFGYWDDRVWEAISNAVNDPAWKRLLFQHFQMKSLLPTYGGNK
jgi:hypothetical protein